MVVGAAEDSAEASTLVAAKTKMDLAKLAGLEAIRLTARWRRGEDAPAAGELAMLKNAVRLTFPKGAQLEDPKELFNARLDSKSVRAIDFRQGEKVPDAAVKALVRAGARLNA